LEAWDVGAASDVRLDAGQLVYAHRVRCEPLAGPALDPYVTEFECGGRLYTCPLYRFQARARIVEPETEPAIPERNAAAV
jgi:hypothetical protein